MFVKDITNKKLNANLIQLLFLFYSLLRQIITLIVVVFLLNFVKMLTLSTLGPPSVTNLTMTGFSEPATKPKPRAGDRSRVTVRGSGASMGSKFFTTGVSYVVVLLT